MRKNKIRFFLLTSIFSLHLSSASFAQFIDIFDYKEVSSGPTKRIVKIDFQNNQGIQKSHLPTQCVDGVNSKPEWNSKPKVLAKSVFTDKIYSIEISNYRNSEDRTYKDKFLRKISKLMGEKYKNVHVIQ